ncbi:rRNA methylase, putative [Ricinus communis]|uniref:rRNA methyltransferase 1, mitochondrial n=2 Tax=Ricinus communis TaxID=3988 RepID=B9RKH2_RICCO|nr:rRNA methylase, putative [Ricinus communis]
MSNLARGRCILSSLRSSASCCSLLRARSFSSSHSQSVAGERSNAVRDGKSLPWLSSRRVKELKGLEKRVSAYNNGPSSWKKSDKRLEKIANGSSWEESAKRLEKDADSVKNLEKEGVTRSARSSWEESVEPALESNRNRMVGRVKDREYDCGFNETNASVDKEEEGEGELDVSEDPRWDKIKNRFNGMTNAKGRTEKTEFNRWNKQENWGRKTWREATESTLPKMVGGGVYGVGPVLAALSAARREFYALYVQEGLDLTNNKKKKDKKGFEKVLKMAQRIGLSIRRVSKHDLNMIVDNRPHQGLVLDASPLEMVKIMELDPVSSEDEKGSLWVALDEVTDPQNLGAIIRSAYFFGAAGIVLCAKNSAPLSGVVSKASAGSLEIMELRYCRNMMQFLVSSADNGWRVLGGSVASMAVPLNEVVPGEPTILVLGSEGTGLRPLVERSCTQLVRIPGNIPMDVTMGGNDVVESEEINLQHSSEGFRSFLAVESLNVSVAAGVLLHHLIGSNQMAKNSIDD